MLYKCGGGHDRSVQLDGQANNETNYFLTGQTQLGVAPFGGPYQGRNVFAVGANGVPRVINEFTGGADGSGPLGRLTVFTDGNYYGTTLSGAFGYGTVFRVSRSGEFSTIHRFTGGKDGGRPQAGLALRVDLGDRANVVTHGVNNRTLEHIAMSSPQCISPSCMAQPQAVLLIMVRSFA